MDQSPAAAAQRLAVNKRALLSAVSTDDRETVVDLLDRGVPIDTKDDEGMSLLHLTALGGHVTTMRLLIGRGCDVDSVIGRGFTPLHLAAAKGQTKAVRQLIMNGASKSVVAGKYGTPLHLAAINNHVETAVAMLEEGCPLDVVDSAGATVLHAASQGGNVGLVRKLVIRGCDVNAVEANGCTPLHDAAASGRTQAVRELIKLGARKSVVGGNCGTPLHRAALNGHVETSVAMLEEGCPLDIVDSVGATVLHSAAEGGNVGLVRELVVRGCDVNAVEANGCTPLHDAAASGRTQAVRELIKLGARKSVVGGNCGTPLHRAALNGHVETSVAMLEEGCHLDIVDSVGATVLHSAAEGGNVDLVRELVGRGCDVNAVEANGCTPLHDAAASGRTQAVRELLKLGARKSVVGGNCGTPLHRAALNGHVETSVAMLEEGCPLDIVDSVGATVLHSAAEGGNVDLVRELVGRGCNVNAVEANGCTPLHYAASRGRTQAVRELIKLGAAKSVVAGMNGTPLHQAILSGHVDTVEAFLEDDCLGPDDLTTCDTCGGSPIMWALRCGHVEVVKLLISKGGFISGRDMHSLSAFEHCFIGGQGSKLSQFCEACGIRIAGEGLRGALATLITQGLVDAHKVLCLCAISGDGIFLEDQFIELVASDTCAMPAAVKCVRYCFHTGEGVPFLNQLRIPDENTLNPLHISLLSLKCYEMGFAICSVKRGTKEHTSFITKLLSHPVLKETVHESFPNGLSPLDLARQFEFHHIAALIEEAGGRPGVWAGVPQEIEVRHPLALRQVKEAYASIKATVKDGEHGLEFIKGVFSSILGAQTEEGVVEVANDSQLVKEQVYFPGFTKQLCSELYRKAIKDGPTVTLHISKAMTVGPPRVGKTFLRHLLLGLPLPEDIKSTAVMETPDVVSLSKSTTKASKNETYVASDEAWVPLTAESGMESLLKILRERGSTVEYDASHSMKLTSKKETISPATSHRDEDVDDTGIQTESSNKWPQYVTSSDPMKSMIGEIHQLLQTIKSDSNVNLQDAHLLQFIDCGGQLAYHDILPIFVNIPAIYLHVFNLMKRLENCPRDEIRFKDGSDCYSATSALTVAEMMTRSMMTINALACKTVQLPDEVKAEGSLKPHVVFVGTHYDEFCTEDGEQTQKELDGISKELENAMPPMPYCFDVIKHGQSRLPAMFFPINNCLRENDASQDSEISRKSTKCLKTAIEKVGSVKVVVPVKWYMYQLLEWGRRGQGHKKCYHYRELYALCKGTRISESAGDFYAMVTYFHSLSLLTHLCGPGESEKHLQDAENCNCMVFTDPSHLFENVTKLYQVQFLEKGYFGNELQSLKCNGILTMSALEKLGVDVEHSCYMDILVQLFIGARLEWKGGEMALFVPSVLANPIDPTVSGVVPQEPQGSQESHESIAIAFEDTSFIPCGVFTGMCARLQSKGGWEICFGCISRMQMKFKVHSRSVVMVFDRTTYIEVRMNGIMDSKDSLGYQMTIINAIAESYCFLFHSRDAQSGNVSCSECIKGPYLQLGKTCEQCHKRFAKLDMWKDYLYECCDGDCVPIHLDGRHHAVFQSISHKVS